MARPRAAHRLAQWAGATRSDAAHRRDRNPIVEGPMAEAPAMPKGLKPKGQLDARFRVAYEHSVPEAMRVMTGWMAALADRDLAGIAAQTHFPFAIFEGTEPLVVESREAFLAAPPASLNVTGRGETQVQAGSHDLLDQLELLIF